MRRTTMSNGSSGDTEISLFLRIGAICVAFVYLGLTIEYLGWRGFPSVVTYLVTLSWGLLIAGIACRK
jgi:hypothetical protein